MDSVIFDKVSESYKIKFSYEGNETVEDFIALDNVSFVVKRGESFCIIGENGAGKTTTLKLIYQMLKPDSGTVLVEGKVSALLDLGAGFNPELTGSENIKVTAALYGLNTQEIKDITVEIEQFSGLGRFIHAPVKTYSQGMFVRLGFALAIHIQSDIILIDDIFAVGDESFQKKCLDKLLEFKQEGKTIIFASHDIAKIREFCDRGILLRDGKVVSEGTAEKIISYYLSTLGNKEGIKVISKNDIGVIFNNGKILITYQGIPVTKHMGLYYSFNKGALWRFSGECSWQIKDSGVDFLLLEGSFSEQKGTIIFDIRISDKAVLVNLKTSKMPLDDKSFQYVNMLLDEDYCSYSYWRGLYHFPDKFVYEKEWEHVSAGEYIGDTVSLTSADDSSLPYLTFSPDSSDSGEFLVQNSGSDLRCRVIQYNLGKFATGAKTHDINFSFALDFFAKDNKTEFDSFFAEKLKDKYIEFEGLKLFYTINGAKLFKEGREITKDSGFNTVFLCGGVEYHSAENVWSCEKGGQNEMIMTCADAKNPFSQQWVFKFSTEGVLSWSITTDSKSKKDTSCLKKAVILSDYYTEIVADDLKEIFPQQYSWVEVLTQENVSFFGVAPVDIFHESNSLPGIIFRDKTIYNKLIVQNSDEKIRGRVLQLFPDNNNADNDYSMDISFCNQEIYQETVYKQVSKIQSKRIIKKGNLSLSLNDNAIDIFFDNEKITHHGGISISFLINEKWSDTRDRKWTFLKVLDNLLQVKQIVADIEVIVDFSFVGEGAVEMKVNLRALRDIALVQVRAGLIVGGLYNSYFDGDDIKNFSSRFFWNDIDCQENRIFVLSDKLAAVEIQGDGYGLIQNTGESIGGRILAKKYLYKDSLSANEQLSYTNIFALTDNDKANAQINEIKKENESKKIITAKDIALKIAGGTIDVSYKNEFIGTKKGLYAAVYSQKTWHDSQSGQWYIKAREGNSFFVSQQFLNTDIVMDLKVVISDNNTVTVFLDDISGSDLGEIRFGIMLPDNYTNYYIGSRKHTFRHSFGWEDVLCGYNNVVAVSEKFPAVEITGTGRTLVQNTDEIIKARIFTKRIVDYTKAKDAFINLKFIDNLEFKNYFETLNLAEEISLSDTFMKFSLDEGAIRVFAGEEELTCGSGLNISFMTGGVWHETSSLNWEVIKKQDNNIILMQSLKDFGVIFTLNIFLKNQGCAAISLEVEAILDITIEHLKLAFVLKDQYTSYYLGGREVAFGDNESWEDIACGLKKVAMLSDLLPMVEFSGFGNALIQKTGKEQSGRIFIRENKEPLALASSQHKEFLAFLNLTPFEAIGKNLCLWQREEDSKREIEQGDLRINETEGSIKIFHKGYEVTKHGGVHTAIKINGRWTDTQRRSWHLEEKTKNTLLLSQYFKELKLTNYLNISLRQDGEMVFENELVSELTHNIEEIRHGIVVQSLYNKYFFKDELVKFNEIFRWHDIECKKDRLICYADNVCSVEVTGEGNGLIQNTAKEISGRILLKKAKENFVLSPGDKYKYCLGVNLLSADNVLEYVNTQKKSKEKKHFIKQDTLSVRESLGSIKIYTDGVELTKQGGLNTAVKVNGKWFDTQKSQWFVEENTGTEIVLKQRWEEINLTNYLSLKITEDKVIAIGNSFKAESDIEIQEIRVAVVLSPNYREYVKGDDVCEFSKVFRWEDIWVENQKITVISREFPCIDFEGEGISLIQNTGEEIAGRILLKSINKPLSLKKQDEYKIANSLRLFDYEEAISVIQDQTQSNKERYYLKQGDFTIYAALGSIKIFHKDVELTKHGGINTAVKIEDNWFDNKSSVWTLKENNSKEMVLSQKWTEIDLENLIYFNFDDDNKIKVKNQFIADKDIVIEQIRCAVVISEIYNKYLDDNSLKNFSSIFRWEDIFLDGNNVVCANENVLAVSLTGNGSALLQNTDVSISARVLLNQSLKPVVLKRGDSYLYNTDISFMPYEKLLDSIESAKQVIESKSFIECGKLLIRKTQGSIKIYYDNKEITKAAGLNTAIEVSGKWYNTESASWEIMQAVRGEMVLRQTWQGIGVSSTLYIGFIDDKNIYFRNEFIAEQDTEISQIRTALVCSDKYKQYLKNLKIVDFPSVFRWEDISCGKERMVLLSDDLPTLEITGKGEGLIQNTDEIVKGRIMLVSSLDKVIIGSQQTYSSVGNILLLEKADILEYVEKMYTIKNQERILTSGDILIKENHGSIALYYKNNEVTKHAGLHVAISVNGRRFDTKGSSWTVIRNKNSEIVLRQKIQELSLVNTLSITIDKKNSVILKNEISANKKVNIEEVRIALVVAGQYDKYFKEDKIYNFSSRYKWEDIICGDKTIMCLSENKPCIELLGKGESLIQNTGEEIAGRILLKKTATNINVSFIKKYSWQGQINFISYADIIKMVDDNYLKRTIAKTIKNGDITLRETAGNLKLYFHEREITTGSGLSNVLKIGSKMYESHNAEIEFVKINSSAASVKQIWSEIGCVFVWTINITRKNIVELKLDIDVQKKIEVEEIKVSVLLNDSYKSWMLGVKRDFFPAGFKWQDMAEGMDDMSVLGADIPAVVFEGNGKSIIQNTDDLVAGRLLVKKCLTEKLLDSGNINVFVGCLSFTDDQKLNESWQIKHKQHSLRRIISAEDIKIKVDTQSIDIYRKQLMLTRFEGLNISFMYKGRLYHFFEASVKVIKLSETALQVLYCFDELNLKIETSISILEKTVVDWKIKWINLDDSTGFDELRAGIFIDGAYNKWICENEMGSFPESVSWSDIKVSNPSLAESVVYNTELRESISFKDLNSISTLLMQNTDKKPKTHFLGRVFIGDIKEMHLQINIDAAFDQINLWANHIMNKATENSYISSIDYTVNVCGNFLKLFYQGRAFSESIGLHSAVLCDSQWYSSQNADWNVERLSPTKMQIICVWHHIALKQEWIIDFTDNNILHWEVLHKPQEGTQIEEIKAGLIVSNEYKQWFNSFESGYFKDNGKWANMEIQHLSSYVNGVFGDTQLPGIAFFDESRSWETLVQNGGEGVMGRLLIWRKELTGKDKAAEISFKGAMKFFPDSSEILNLIQQQRALFWQEQHKGKYIFLNDIMLLVDDGGKIKIFYQGKLVTADIGLNTKFISGDNEYKSDYADLKIISADGNVLKFSQEWSKEGIVQYFDLKVEGQSIFVSIDIDLKKKTVLRQKRIALRLLSDFAFFREDKKEDIRRKNHLNDLSSRIFYIGSAENKNLDLLWVPEVFDCVQMYSFFHDQKRDENEMLLYLASSFKDNIYPKGRHSYYKGCINLCLKQKEKQNLFSKQKDYCDKFLETEAELRSNEIAIKFNKNAFDLYKGSMLLTKGLGIYSSYLSENIWHDSKSALWSVESNSKTKMVLSGIWTQIPMRQRWTFDIKDNTIAWKIEREIYDDFSCQIEQINIMAVDKYTSFAAGKMAQGLFPSDFEANSGMLWDCMWSGRAASASIILNAKSGKKYPTLTFDFKKQGTAYRAVIENTDQNYKARVLQCQKLNSAEGVLKAHPLENIFEGVIEIDNV